MSIRLLWRQREGATILEFALVAPVLFPLMCGIVERTICMYASAVIAPAVLYVVQYPFKMAAPIIRQSFGHDGTLMIPSSVVV